MARSSSSKLSIFGELWAFMKVRKKWWLGPIVLTMVMLSALIVLTPDDAYLCFMRTNMDVLVLGNQILLKEEQPELHEDFDWRERFALD